MAEHLEQLKELASRIHEQQKAILAAALGIVLFLLAPQTNEMLAKGATELSGLDLGKVREDVADALTRELREAPIPEALRQKLQAAKITSEAPAESLGDSDRQALGVREPETLNDLLLLLEGDATRCAPKLDTNVERALPVLAGDGLRVGQLEFIAVSESDALGAVRRVSEAALGVVRKKAACDQAPQPEAGAAAPPSTKLESYSHAPARYIDAWEGGQVVTRDNPLYSAWLAQKKKAEEARSDVDRRRLVRDQLRSELDGASADLYAELERLRQAVDTQLQQDEGPTRHVVAALGVSGGGRYAADALYLPMACSRAPLLAGAGPALVKELGGKAGSPVLSHLRSSDAWEKLGAAALDQVERRTAQALLATQGSVSVFGLDVHESLLTRLAPWLLAALLFWHAVHVVRFRQLCRLKGVRESLAATMVLPTVPARQNLLVPLLVACAVTAVSVWLMLRSPGDWLSIGVEVLAVLLALASLTLVLLIRTPGSRE